MKRVLFVCTGSRARSQMAEGLLRHLAGDRFEVFSAGTEPKSLAEETVAVMEEISIGVSGQRSKSVDAFVGQEFDYVITVCDSARQACPAFPGRGRRLHWSVEDPADTEAAGATRLEVFRKVRDGRVPLPAKLVLPGVGLYLIMPLDLIPDFIPVIGYLDDLVVVVLGLWLFLRLSPPEIFREHVEALRAET